MFNDLLPIWRHIFSNGHKIVHVGSGFGMLIEYGSNVLLMSKGAWALYTEK